MTNILFIILWILGSSSSNWFFKAVCCSSLKWNFKLDSDFDCFDSNFDCIFSNTKKTYASSVLTSSALTGWALIWRLTSPNEIRCPRLARRSISSKVKKHFWTVLRMVGHNINVVRTVGHDFGRCRTDHMQFFPLISLSNGFSWKFLFDFSHFQIKFVFFHWISSNFSLLRNDSVLVANKHYRVIAFESSVWQLTLRKSVFS